MDLKLNSFVADCLNESQYLSLCSFLQHSFKVRLFTYNQKMKIPAGVDLADARDILDINHMFLDKSGSTETFSIYFKYHFLYYHGGPFVTLDLFCINQFSLNKEKTFITLSSPKNKRRYICSGFISVGPFDRTIKACLEAMKRRYQHSSNQPLWEKDVLTTCIISERQLASLVSFEDLIIPLNTKDIDRVASAKRLKSTLATLPAKDTTEYHNITFILISHAQWGIESKNIDTVIRIIRRVTRSPVQIFEIGPVQTYQLSNNFENARYRYVPDVYESARLATFINDTIQSISSKKICVWRSNIIISPIALQRSIRMIEIQNCALCIPYNRQKYIDDILFYFFKNHLNFSLLPKLLTSKHNISKNYPMGVYLVDKDQYCALGGEDARLFNSTFENSDKIRRIKLAGHSLYVSTGYGYHLSKQAIGVPSSPILFRYYVDKCIARLNKAAP